MPTAPKFDPREAFFVIDSDHLDQISSEFYGFTILDNTIVRTVDGLENRVPEGDGAYVYICREPETITLYQDFMGSYGLYLFRDGDYFALSNSFVRLVDHVKQTHQISMNRDYADFFLAADLCSVAYGETMVNEIQVLDRCAEAEIHIPDRQLTIRYRDYLENTVELSSREGMELLDKWFHKWAGLMRNLKKQTNNIQTDLSGGFDSRLVFSLLLGSGVNLSDIFVFSIHDKLHTHAEDYEIASALAEHYGFRLNNSTALTPGISYETSSEILNISLYTKLSFHKQLYHQFHYFAPPRYNFVGNGGECIRDYWNMSAEEFTNSTVKRCRAFPKEVSARMEQSVRNVLGRAFEGIQEKFTGFGRPIAPEELTVNLYRETRCRNHFGKSIVERYLANSITCAPLLDPLLHRLKRSDRLCQDNNLLIAVILSRFDRHLLNFKFDNKRRITPATVLYAATLNLRYSFRSCLDTAAIPAPQEQSLKRMAAIPAATITDLVMGTFGSKAIKESIIHLYDDETYQVICKDVAERSFYPLQNAYASISAAWIAQETQLSRYLARSSLAGSLFSSTPAETKPAEESLWNHPNLENHITARVDLKLMAGDLEILEISDPKASVSTPKWFSALGKGYVIESRRGSLTLRVRCPIPGMFTIALRGRAVQDPEGTRIPYWIDLTRVQLNGTDRITKLKPICHDVPMKIEQPVGKGDIQELTICWEPHDERKNRLLDRRMKKKEGGSSPA